MSFEAPPPDPTAPDLLDNLRQFLINAGLVRDPRDASKQSSLPPMWLAPRHGVPAPGQTEGLNAAEVSPLPPNGPGIVMAAIPATDIPPARYEGFLRHNVVDLVFRGRTPQPVLSLENKIRAQINDKRAYQLVNVPVNESLLFRGLQPMGADSVAYNYLESYIFDLWGPFTQVEG